MKCGIIGLPNVGKTALFNLLTQNSAASSNYPYCTVEPNNGVAVYRDRRLERIAGLYPGSQIEYPHINFTDVAGLPPGASRGEGLGNQFLSNIRDADAVLHVVRAFSAPEVSRYDSSSAEPARDMELVQTELFLADLEIASRRLKENPASKYWKETVKRLEEQKTPDPDEEGVLITPKPQIIVLNVTSGMTRPEVCQEKVIYMDVAYQKELSEMPENDRKAFEEELPEWESSIDDILEKVKNLLNLVTFFTVKGGKEVRGYNITKGSSAYEAAGKIHTDMQKGFVRARVYKFNELAESDFNINLLKSGGKVRTEGKDYEVRDGDIIEILFS